MSGKFKIEVNSYSGYRESERPVSFRLGSDTIKVKEIVDRWYEPDAIYFKVLGSDENNYILRHNEADHSWELTFFSSSNTSDR